MSHWFNEIQAWNEFPINYMISLLLLLILLSTPVERLYTDIFVKSTTIWPWRTDITNSQYAVKSSYNAEFNYPEGECIFWIRNTILKSIQLFERIVYSPGKLWLTNTNCGFANGSSGIPLRADLSALSTDFTEHAGDDYSKHKEPQLIRQSLNHNNIA